MPSNPFSFRKPTDTDSLGFDEWGGEFECQTPRCHAVATVAKYFADLKWLVWTCPNGHESKVEDVEDE